MVSRFQSDQGHGSVTLSPAEILAVAQQRSWMWQTPVLLRVLSRLTVDGSFSSQELYVDSDAPVRSYF